MGAIKLLAEAAKYAPALYAASPPKHDSMGASRSLYLSRRRRVSAPAHASNGARHTLPRVVNDMPGALDLGPLLCQPLDRAQLRLASSGQGLEARPRGPHLAVWPRAVLLDRGECVVPAGLTMCRALRTRAADGRSLHRLGPQMAVRLLAHASSSSSRTHCQAKSSTTARITMWRL